MRTLSFLPVLVIATSIGCSGGRDERVGSDCVTDRQCTDGAECISGRCVGGGDDDENVEREVGAASVTAQVEGAPADVRVTARDAEQECSQSEEFGLLCTLSMGAGVVLVAPEVEGHRFSHWDGGQGCSGEAPELELSGVKAHVDCTAHYVRRVRVRGEVAGEGVAAALASSEDPFARCEAGECEVDVGQSVTLLVPARDGFRLDAFEGDGCGQREGYRVTVGEVQADVVCTASFVASLTIRGQTSGLGELATEAENEVVASSIAPNALCEGPLCAIDAGQAVVLRAPEVPGFRFTGWRGDAACVGDGPELTIANAGNSLFCTAEYVARFTVSGASEGADAEVSAAGTDLFSVCDGPACEVDRGQSVTLLAGSVDGFRLASWLGEGCEALPGASAIVREVAGDVTCTAQYIEGVSVSGTVVNAQGEVQAVSASPGAECATGSCAIDIGGDVTLTAPTIPGRTFVGWSGDSGCTGDEPVLTLLGVESSKTCRATFAARHVVTASPAPAAGGSTTATSTSTNAACRGASCEVDEGSTVRLQATAASGFRFSGWTGGGPCAGSTAQISVPNVRSGVTCTANFVQRIEVRGAVSPAGAATVVASQAGALAECTGDKCVVDAGSNVSLQATATPSWRFVNWSGCGSPLNPLLALNPLAVLGPTANTVCTANFTKVTYAVQTRGSTGGEGAALLGGQRCPGDLCQVEHGGSVTLRAYPDDGYQFTGWTGVGCEGAQEHVLSNVTAPIACNATFAKVTHTVTALGSSGGRGVAKLNGTPCPNNVCRVEDGGSVTVAAVPDDGYAFVRWTGTGCAGEAEHTVTGVAGPLTCTATFALRTVAITALRDPANAPAPTITAPGASCSGDTCTVQWNGEATLRAEGSSKGWQFLQWDCPWGSSPETVVSVREAKTDQQCTARYRKRVAIVTHVVGTGTVNCAVGQECWADAGSNFEIVATPNPGWDFSHWENCSSATTERATITVGPPTTGTLVCRAVFVPEPPPPPEPPPIFLL